MNKELVAGQADLLVHVLRRLPSGLVETPFEEHLLQQTEGRVCSHITSSIRGNGDLAMNGQGD